MKSSRLVVAGITGALLVGAGGGFVMSMASGASAQPTVTAATEPGTPATDGVVPPPDLDDDSDYGPGLIGRHGGMGHGGMGHGGTGHGGTGHGGMGHGGMGHGGFDGPGNLLRIAATTIGITPEELMTAIRSGQTIAEISTANSVAVPTVIDALVSEATANVTDRITNMVNGVHPDDDIVAPTTTVG